MKHKELTYKIIGVFYDVYNELGHGFLESVYHRSLGLALEAEGLKVSNYVKIPVWFRGERVGQFEGDMLVEDSILLELKVARCLDQSHQAQLLNYLRATDIEVGNVAKLRLKAAIQEIALGQFAKSRSVQKLAVGSPVFLASGP